MQLFISKMSFCFSPGWIFLHFPLLPTIFYLFSRLLLFSPALFSLVNTIAQAVSCCRHFVADHGAESLLPSNCHSVHFMVHIPCSPFLRVPLAPTLISLTPSLTNNNKSNAHLFHLAVTALVQLSGFQLRLCHVLYIELSLVDNMLHGVFGSFCASVLFSETQWCCIFNFCLLVCGVWAIKKDSVIQGNMSYLNPPSCEHAYSVISHTKSPQPSQHTVCKLVCCLHLATLSFRFPWEPPLDIQYGLKKKKKKNPNGRESWLYAIKHFMFLSYDAVVF